MKTRAEFLAENPDVADRIETAIRENAGLISKKPAPDKDAAADGQDATEAADPPAQAANGE